MGNMRITANVARAIVDAGTAKNYKATQTVRKPQLIEPTTAQRETEGPTTTTTEFLTGLGEPETRAAVVEVSTEAIPFLTGIETAPVEIIVGVALEITEDASLGAVPVVVAIDCDNGELVVTTKYIRTKITNATIRTYNYHTTHNGVSSVSTVTENVVAQLPKNNPTGLGLAPYEA